MINAEVAYVTTGGGGGHPPHGGGGHPPPGGGGQPPHGGGGGGNPGPPLRSFSRDDPIQVIQINKIKYVYSRKI